MASLTLSSPRLEVTVDPPGTGYIGTRFDWTTQVRQVVLDGRHTFLTREKRDEESPQAQGWGLAGEFGIDTPLGYADCPVGGQFPKVGVGMLTRVDGHPYHFARDYPVTPARFLVDQEGSDRVRFTADQAPSGGWGWNLVRSWRTEEADLVLETQLTNTGTRPLATEEYIHNFLAFDGLPVGPGWELDLSESLVPDTFVKLVDPEDLLNIGGPGLTWTKTPTADFFLATRASVHTWTLAHRPLGLSVTETADFPVSRFHLWGQGHVASPELYRTVAVAQGQTLSWVRRWRFHRNTSSVVS